MGIEGLAEGRFRRSYIFCGNGAAGGSGLWQPNNDDGSNGITMHSIRTPWGKLKVCFTVVFSTAWRSAVSTELSPLGVQYLSNTVGWYCGPFTLCDMISVSPRTLLAAIHKFKPTLRALSLWKVTLLPQDQQRHLDPIANAWAELFGQLSDLDYISVGYLSQVLRDQTQQVKFKLPADQSGEMSLTKEYSGYDMRHFPDNLVSDTVVDWPKDSSDRDDGMLYPFCLKSSKRDNDYNFLDSMSDTFGDDEDGTDDGE